MAKKEKLKLGGADISDDLDFGDFDFSDIDSKVDKDISKNKRKPVASAFKGAISGAKTSAMSRATMAKFLRSALPKEYGETIDRTGDVTSEVSSLYNEAVKQIKPNLVKMTKEVDKLIPGEMKRSKGYLKKLQALIGEETSSTSRGDDRDAMLQGKLAEIFSVQAEQQERQHAEESAKGHLQGKIAADQFKSTFGLLNSINVSLSKLSNYNEKVNSAYQKKSLELQYRSYFVQQELLDTTKKFYEIFKAQNEAISLNTSLPDYAKLRKWEMFKDVTQRKFAGAGSKLFSSSEYLKKGMKNLRTAAMNKISTVGGAFSEGAMGLESANSMRDMMGSMGGESGGMAGMAGEFAGQTGIEALAQMLGGKLAKKTPKQVKDLLHKLSKTTGNMQGSVNRLKKSDSLKWNFDDEMGGMKGKAKNAGRDALRALLNIFDSGNGDTQLAGHGGIHGLTQNAIFDNRAHKSVTDVIPGYLSRIFRELQVIRSGNTNVQLTDYDYKSGRFINKAATKTGIDKMLGKAATSSYHEYKTDEAYKTIVGDKQISASAEKALRGKVFDSTFSADITDAKTIRGADFTKGLSATDASEIQAIISANFNPLASDYAKKDYDLANSVNAARDSINDIRGIIQGLYNAGYGNDLKQMGIITLKGDNVSINMEAYKKLVKSGTLGKVFSQKVKRGASNKPGTIVPAAAPAPTIQQTIPLTQPTQAQPAAQTRSYRAMSGITGASSGESTLPVLTGIKSDTALIIERLDALGKIGFNVNKLDASGIKEYFDQLKKKSSDKMHGFGDFVSSGSQRFSDKIGSLARGNPKTMMGNVQNLAASAGALLAKTVENVTSGLFKGGKNVNDKLVQPGKQLAGKLYKDNKDSVISSAKYLFGQGMGLVTTVFDRAREGVTDLIKNKLPAGFKQLADVGGWLKQKAKNILDEATDIYVAGRKAPALRAVLMRAGAYFDQKTGKPITNPGDIEGTVVNADGEVVLSLEDISKGIFNKTGERISSLSKKLLALGLGVAKSAYDKVKGALSNLSGLGAGVSNKISGFFNKHLSALGGSQQISLLTQIRDVLNTRLPGRAMKFKDSVGSQGSTRSKQAEIITTQEHKPEAKYGKSGGLFGKVKDKFNEAKSHMPYGLGDKAKDKFGKAKNFMNGKLGGSPFMTPGIIDFMKSKNADKDKPRDRAGDQLQARRDAADKTKQGRYVAQASLDPRYKSGTNVLDSIAEKAGSVYDTIKGGLSSLADIADIGGGRRGRVGRGKGGLLRRGGGALVRGASTVGRGIMAAGSMLPGAATAGRVLSIGRTALMAGSLMTGGLGGAVMGGLGLIGSALASPFVLGAGAAALAGYGLYKGYKFMTRNSVSKLDTVRMMQYGVDSSHSSSYHLFMQLEAQLTETAVKYNNGRADLNERAIDINQILEIFSINKEDNTGALERFVKWLTQRFKPVFLTHLTALYSVDPKKHLDDTDKLKPEQKDKYLKAVETLSSVYGFTDSPFEDGQPITVTPNDITAAIKSARDEFKDDLPKDDKDLSILGKAVKFITRNEGLDKAIADGGIKGAIAKIASYVPGLTLGLNIAQGAGKLAFSIGKKIRSFFSGPPSALESVRFKTYGLKESNSTKISALRDLEGAMTDYVKMSGKTAVFAGDIANVIKDVGSSFGVSGLTDDQAQSWVKWFHSRFLPTFLSFVGSGFGLIGKAEASEIEPRLNDKQKYDLALRVSGTDVWTVQDTPWTDDTVACTKTSDCSDNLAFLKEKASKDDLKQEAIKEGNKSASTAKVEPIKPPPAIEVPKTETPTTSEAPVNRRQAEMSKIGFKPINGPADMTSSSGGSPGTPSGSSGSLASISGTPGILPNTITGTSAANSAYGSTGAPKPNTSNTLGPSFGYTGKVVTGKEDVKAIINEASQTVGVDPNIMQAFAAIESNMNPNAKAPTSSATGLYQFINDTWKGMLKRHGKKYGFDLNTPPTDPRANSLMGAEFIKENMNAMRRYRPNPTAGDLYAAHFLGSGGANQLFSLPPDTPVAPIMPKPAAANASIFYNKDKSPRTASQLMDYLNNLVKNKAAKYGITLGGMPTVASTLPPTTGGKGGNNAPPDTSIGTGSAEASSSSTGSTTPPTVIAMNTQGKPTVGLTPSANDGSYSQPPRTTAPSTFVAPEMIPPEPAARAAPGITLAGMPPVSPGTRASAPARALEQGQGFSVSGSDQSLNKIDSTLSQSLNIQTQMLTALQQLVTTMNPSQMQDALKLLASKIGGDSSSATGNKGAASTPTPGVNLTRKAA